MHIFCIIFLSFFVSGFCGRPCPVYDDDSFYVEPKYPAAFNFTFKPRDITKVVKLRALKDPGSNIWEESGLLEGDIAQPNLRNVAVKKHQRWPGGIVPVIIDQCAFSDSQLDIIKEAMQEIESHTCVIFRDYKPSDIAFVKVQGIDHGCWSMVGRYIGGQIVNLQTGDGAISCIRHGTVVHELLHSLGLHHQHSSPDRDDFIDIQWQNIKSGMKRNFKKLTWNDATTFRLPYDYGSIMHYRNIAFSANKKPTIVTRTKNVKIGQRVHMSQIDIEKINKLYKCKKPTIPTPPMNLIIPASAPAPAPVIKPPGAVWSWKPAPKPWWYVYPQVPQNGYPYTYPAYYKSPTQNSYFNYRDTRYQPKQSKLLNIFVDYLKYWFNPTTAIGRQKEEESEESSGNYHPLTINKESLNKNIESTNSQESLNANEKFLNANEKFLFENEDNESDELSNENEEYLKNY